MTLLLYLYNVLFQYPPQGRPLEILRGRGSQKPTFLKESMKLNWNFQRGVGVGVQPQNPSVVGVWIFSGTTQLSVAWLLGSDITGQH